LERWIFGEISLHEREGVRPKAIADILDIRLKKWRQESPVGLVEPTIVAVNFAFECAYDLAKRLLLIRCGVRGQFVYQAIDC